MEGDKMTSETAANTTILRGGMKLYVAIGVAVAAVAAIIGSIALWRHTHPIFEFRKDDIELLQIDLATDFSQAGFDVLNYSFIRESPRKISGWIKLRPKKMPDSFPAFTKDCTLIMSDLDGYVMRSCN